MSTRARLAARLCALATPTFLGACAAGGGGSALGDDETRRTYATPVDPIAPHDTSPGDRGEARPDDASRRLGDDETDVAVAPPDMSVPLGSTCALSFPPAASMPCEIREAGPLRYVAPDGDDARDGLTPATAWRTLFHAARSTPDGGTVRVAEGEYTSARVRVARPLVIKGGFDATFATWDPDAHPSFVYGALTVDHDDAVFGGFRLVSRYAGTPTDPPEERRHVVSAGALVRSYVEVVYTASEHQQRLSAIAAGAAASRHTRLACNDVYVRAEGRGVYRLGVEAISLAAGTAHAGHADIHKNRVCVDRGEHLWYARGIAGRSGGGAAPAFVLLTNDDVEVHGDGGPMPGAVEGVRFDAGTTDLDVVLSHDTITSDEDGLAGRADLGTGKVRWRITNNVVSSDAGIGRAAHLARGPVEASRIAVLESADNVFSGFLDSTLYPAALYGAAE